MNTITLNVTIEVYAESEEEAIDIVTEILEADAAIDTYKFNVTDATV